MHAPLPHAPYRTLTQQLAQAYRQSVLDFMVETGMMGIETDGEYEGAFCGDSNSTGDHHHVGGAGSWHAQMQVTSDFNAAVKNLGGYQTSADAYYWSGVNRWNHADTDAGFGIPSFYERVAVGRDYVYDSTTTRLHSSGCYMLFDLTRITVNNSECPSRLACIDFGLASYLGQGITGIVAGASLWDATDPAAPLIEGTFSNWTRFFRTHRAILTSEASLHIARPTLRALEASAHLDADPDARERGFLSVYNPTDATLSDTFAVSLYYAGMKPSTDVAVTRVYPHGPADSPVTHTLGSDGGIFDISVPVSVAPKSYAFFSISQL